MTHDQLTAHDQARIALGRALQNGTDPELYDTIADTTIEVAAGCDERTLLRLAALVGLVRVPMLGPVDHVRATFDERHRAPVPEYRTERRDADTAYDLEVDTPYQQQPRNPAAHPQW